jgi:S1-C subfamily serine protease
VTANVTANLRSLTTTPTETPTSNALSTKPYDRVEKSYVETVTSSRQLDDARSQTTNENKLLPVASSLATNSGGWIGITGLTGVYGVIITDLTPTGPARASGLKIGDTIIGVDDASVKTIQMINTITSSRVPGSSMKFSYIRNGVASETTVIVQVHQ